MYVRIAAMCEETKAAGGKRILIARTSSIAVRHERAPVSCASQRHWRSNNM